MSRVADKPIWRNRSPRTVAALIVLGLHLVLILIFSASLIVKRTPTPEQTLVWINLPPLPREPVPTPKVSVPPSALRIRPRIVLPPSSNAITEPAPSATSPATTDQMSNAIRDYVGCGAGEDRKSPAAAARCAQLRGELVPGPAPQRPLTDLELAHRRQFDAGRDSTLAKKPMCDPPIQDGKLCGGGELKPGNVPAPPNAPGSTR